MKKGLSTIVMAGVAAIMLAHAEGKIDRKALMDRSSPTITSIDSLSSLSVGNGSFAVTVDATGLQSYPEHYANGIPLNAMSDWGWHSFPNTERLSPRETEMSLDLGHGHRETYAVEYKQEGRNHDATNYFRANPHRLNLGTVGLVFTDGKGKTMDCTALKDINQRLDLWNGIIKSEYTVEGSAVRVETGGLPLSSGFYAQIESPLMACGKAKVAIRFSYPTGKHSDDANDWSKPMLHSSTIVARTARSAVIERRLDSTVYYVEVAWEGVAKLREEAHHRFVLSSADSTLAFRVIYSPTREGLPASKFVFAEAKAETSDYWNAYWTKGAAVDFSHCTDPRARELERRVVLSQYLMAINCANTTPPQETGLTYNSWFGRPHLEMTFWHELHFALWGRPDVMKTVLRWYNDKAAPVAHKIAKRQGFKGMRWMKMTDPEAGEAPSNVGSFLLWQQPHYIYMAEEMYRVEPSAETLALYGNNVEATAEFMADFAHSCKPADGGKIKLFGATAMQESMSKDFSYNHPFEQAYWHYALGVAQRWRERMGKPRRYDWDKIIESLAPLTINGGIYQAGESLGKLPDSVFAEKSRSDHPAVLGVAGLFAGSPLYEKKTMERTLLWVIDNWNWATTWGWDYGMAAMCAATVGRSDLAIDLLLCKEQKNTYLPNGHNYQEPRRLRLYLPGNGSLLAAVAMMCAGWDGADGINPGFPKDGTWNVEWEGLKRMQGDCSSKP